GALSILNNNGTASTYSLTGAAANAVLQVNSGGILINHTSATSGTVLQLGGTNVTAIDGNNQEMVITAVVTGSGVNQRTDISSQIRNIAALTVGGGTATGGNTAPVNLAVAQAGTGWATSGGEVQVNIASGYLRSSVAAGLPTNSRVYIAGNGTFDSSGVGSTLAGLVGTGAVTNSAGASTGNAAVQTITLSGSNTYVFDGLFLQQPGVTGPANNMDLVKAGTGTQTFTNNQSSYLRAVTVNGGTLAFTGNVTQSNNGGVSSTVTAGNLNYAGSVWTNGSLNVSGGTLNFTGRNLVLSNFAGLNVTGGTVNLTGPADATNADVVYVSGNISVTGGALTTGTGPAVAPALYVMGTTTFAQTAAGSNVTINGSGNVFGGPATFANNGTLSINGTSTFNNSVDVRQQAGGVSGVAFGAGSTVVFNGPVALDWSAVSVGAGAQVQFAGPVTFRGGTVSVDPAAGVRLPGTAGTVTVGDDQGNAATSLLATSAGQTIARPIATGRGVGTVTLGATAATGTTTFSGPLTLNSQLLVRSDAGGTVLLSGAVTSDPSGAYGLQKTGGGTVVLSAASTYTGGTSVTAGVLRVDNATGSGTGSGAVVVDADATLGGVGSIAGPVSVYGKLAPGGNPGRLSLTGTALTLAATSVFEAEVGKSAPGATPVAGVDYDQTALSGGTTTIADGAQLKVIDLPTIEVGDVYTVLDNLSAGTLLAGAFRDANNGGAALPEGATVFGTNGAQYTISYSGNDVTLTTTVVPEPTAAGLMGVAAIGLLARRQRRARR
ncbi:MAG TPA: autotransporter-associated beta strand repeat-containing protein, partial [Humisphaera sp.]